MSATSITIRICLMLLLALSGACGASAPPVEQASAASAAAQIYVGSDAGAASLRSLVVRRLLELRYAVSEDKGHADLIVELVGTQHVKPSLIAVTVNGKRQVNYSMTVTAGVKSDDVLLASTRVEYDSDETPDSDRVDTIVAAVTGVNLPGIVKRREEAARLKAKADSEQKQRDEEKRKAEVAREAVLKDDKAWLDAKDEQCREPRRPDACNAVQKYLVDFGDGRHTAEAKAVLEASKSKLAVVQKDEVAWASSGADACRKARTKEACMGMEIYVSKFGAGLHVDEAKSLMEQQP